MQKMYDELYKLDSKGKTRVWFMEQDGANYRTFDGMQGGKIKASGWRTAKTTNAGRSNERDPVAQATFEIEAAYTKQLKGAYYTDVNDIHLGCRYTEPMLADKYVSFRRGDAQPKLDGIRCLLKPEGGFSREGEFLPGARHIRARLDPLFQRFPNLILDGELYNHELKDDFNELVSLIKKDNPSPERKAKIESVVQYHIYDIASLTAATWEQRSQAIRALFPLNDDLIIPVQTVHCGTEELYDNLHVEWVSLGFEGSMWRDRDALYEQGSRSKSLQKRKDFDDEEFDVVAIEQGEGNWAGVAKRVVCWLPNADRSIDLTDKKAREANTFEAGIRGNKTRAAELMTEQHDVVTVRFFGWTPSAIPKPRFGVVTKFHGAKRTL